MSTESERAARAAERRARITLRKTTLSDDHDPSPVYGEEAVALAWALSQEAWLVSGREIPAYSREETPYRFVARTP